MARPSRRKNQCVNKMIIGITTLKLTEALFNDAVMTLNRRGRRVAATGSTRQPTPA